MKRDKKARINPRLLASRAKNGDVQSLAQLLSLVERDFQSVLKFLSQIKPSAQQIRIGITGPPGSGKSSLINLLIKFYREKKMRVGVLAVDPSSPFSGGALLGDRIRMGGFSKDKDVFIRSIGSRGALGGLSAATGAMARVMAYCGFELLIIETVGVGQTELQVMNLADVTAVVLVPESGDFVQTLKAGILEIADVFIVNKSDRPCSEILAKELEALVQQEGLNRREVFLISVINKTGVAPLSERLLEIGKKMNQDKTRLLQKARGELRSLLVSAIDQDIQDQINTLEVEDAYMSLGHMKIPSVKLGKLRKGHKA